VAQDEGHFSFGGLLKVGVVRRKGYFWNRSMQGGKDRWKEKQHVQVEQARRVCKEYLMTLGLRFL
jgi:hypothetical protein